MRILVAYATTEGQTRLVNDFLGLGVVAAVQPSMDTARLLSADVAGHQQAART